MNKLTIVILAAGKGTRMKSKTHKVLHPIGGLPMVGHLLAMSDKLAEGGATKVDRLLVIGSLQEQLEAAYPNEKFVLQQDQKGTGHAALVCQNSVEKGSDLLVMFGDTPLISAQTVQNMISLKSSDDSIGVVVLGFESPNPKGYGRLITDEASGDLVRIVEEKDATSEERAVTLCNSGVMLIDGAKAFDWLEALQPNNAAGELYLTDVPALARAEGRTVRVVTGSQNEVQGVNSRVDLARVEALFQQQMRQSAMEKGVTLTAPETIFFSHDTEIGVDTVIEPNVVFGPGVVIEDTVTIKAFSHLEGAVVQKGASVGPYARIRPGSDIGPDAKIGNFVETKKAQIEAGAKVSHLSYIGDARVGTQANIGAGTITCNYDGYNKSHTDIGADAFIGSNTALVAPVSVGDGAIVGAGSVITKSVEKDSIGLTRAPHQEKKGAAPRLRERLAALKERRKKDAR